MKMEDAVGIDVSKETIDVRIHTNQGLNQFQNKNAGFKQLLKWVVKSGLNLTQVRFCAENTGLYSHALSEFMACQDLHFSLVPALEIKRSLGITRGKDDVLDAGRIAQYAYLRRDILEDYVPLSPAMQELKKLIRFRRKLVRDLHGYTVTISESARVLKKKDHTVYFKGHQSMAREAKKQIANVENEIVRLIRSDKELFSMFQLLQTVCGIGPVIAPFLIAYTDGFRRFKTWRQFACYIGIAPFPFRSGTSIKGKSKVSHLANKELKALIFLAASSASQSDPELRIYYQARISAGKSPMSTLNIIRNKIIARAFAVVHRQTPYVKSKSLAA
jgi:transposase